MSDEIEDLVGRLLDWPYQGETMAAEAAVLIKQLTAERDHAWAMVANADTQVGQSLADHLQATAERDRLRQLLSEAASDLTAYVDAEYPPETCAQYPDIARRHHRDMELVRRIEAELKGETP